MKKLVRPFVLGLGAALLVGQLSVQAQTGSTVCKDKERESKVVQLYFVRNTEVAKRILDTIKNGNTALAGLIVDVNTTSGIVLNGCPEQIMAMSRVIASLDLPRPGINLEMWGIQLSSSNPEELGKVIQEVNGVIAQTQRLMQATYAGLDKMAVAVEIDTEFQRVFENELGYTDALDPYRTLSMSDILVRIIAAKDPHLNAKAMAKNIEDFFNKPEYQDYKAFVVLQPNRRPFGRFLATQGLTYCPYGDKPKGPIQF
jgi:hypothetical protein